jgi:hypothetical protein
MYIRKGVVVPIIFRRQRQGSSECASEHSHETICSGRVGACAGIRRQRNIIREWIETSGRYSGDKGKVKRKSKHTYVVRGQPLMSSKCGANVLSCEPRTEIGRMRSIHILWLTNLVFTRGVAIPVVDHERGDDSLDRAAATGGQNSAGCSSSTAAAT